MQNVTGRVEGFRAGALAAAHRCADVLDALRDPDRPDDVRAALARRGETTAAQLTDAEVADLAGACGPLWACARAGDTAAAAAALNTALSTTRPVRLSGHGSTAWHLHADSDDERADWSEWFVASSALALAILVAEDQRPPLSICSADDCTRPYVTGGRGRTRQYCTRTCATRTRVHRHRAERP